MKDQVKVSIIISVYNAKDYLEESLECIKKQNFKEYEIICVDYGSTDGSSEILQRYAKYDSRYVILTQKNKGSGAARNTGLATARGEYVIFLDSDDLFSPELLEKTYATAIEYQADIVAFNFSQFDIGGNKKNRQGIHIDWLSPNKKVFNYRDCPDLIMSIANSTPWNKLYRRSFILNSKLKYEEISSSNDITFAAVSMACAERITYINDSLVEYRKGHLGTVTSTKSKRLDNIVLAVKSAVDQAKALPHSSTIMNSIHRFAIDNYIVGLKNYVVDFNNANTEQYYEYVHNYFLEEEFDGITSESLHNEELFRYFCIIRKYNYQEMRTHLSKKMIVSMTSYPARINNLSLVLDSIHSQSHKADEIILWLADTEFPNYENDLPDYLRQLISENRITIRWCEDLKPHKKYFYALQEYTDTLVVTIDDDLIYSPQLLEKLFESYLLYPNAVSAARTHLITISEDNEILPYDDWIKETDAFLHQPSMQLFCTGGAGMLCPSDLILPELFNKEAIKQTCLWADDLWLKVIQLLSDVPVVTACPHEALRYVPGSQDEALYHKNVDLCQNDVQLARISKWLNKHYEENILINKLTTSDIGEKLLGVKALCQCFRKERKNMRAVENRLRTAYESKSEINAKLQRTYQEKSEINKKLQAARDEKSEINVKLQKTYKEKAEINAKLQRTYQEKSEINAKLQKTYQEKSEINAKLQRSYQKKSEINAKLQKTYQEKSEINRKLQAAWDEKSEINAKLQIAYKEKSERGLEIKRLNSELKNLQEENEHLKNYIEQEKNKKIVTKVRKLFSSVTAKRKEYD